MSSIPIHALGMGLSVMSQEAKGEGRAVAPARRRVLLPGLQAQREGAYFGKARGRVVSGPPRRHGRALYDVV